MSAPDISLLAKRRFGPMFVVQFLGAFNDNLLKFAMLFLANFVIFAKEPAKAELLAAVATGLFILPYFLFSALAGQLDSLPTSYQPDVAVIVVGGNDVTHRVPVAESVRNLAQAIRRLRERDVVVVVGTCPDLGALRDGFLARLRLHPEERALPAVLVIDEAVTPVLLCTRFAEAAR